MILVITNNVDMLSRVKEWAEHSQEVAKRHQIIICTPINNQHQISFHSLIKLAYSLKIYSLVGKRYPCLLTQEISPAVEIISCILVLNLNIITINQRGMMLVIRLSSILIQAMKTNQKITFNIRKRVEKQLKRYKNWERWTCYKEMLRKARTELGNNSRKDSNKILYSK